MAPIVTAVPPCIISSFTSLVQSWSRSPPSPRGCSRLTFGPVINPSSDIETSSTAFPMWVVALLSGFLVAKKHSTRLERLGLDQFERQLVRILLEQRFPLS